MNPLKRKEISRRTAEKLDREFTEVDDIVSFFYSQVQKSLSNMQNVAVNVPNLGTFMLKKKRLLNKLEKYRNYLKNIDKAESLNAFEKRLVVKKDIESYEAALSVMAEEEMRKAHVHTLKEKRYADQSVEGAQ